MPLHMSINNNNSKGKAMKKNICNISLSVPVDSYANANELNRTYVKQQYKVMVEPIKTNIVGGLDGPVLLAIQDGALKVLVLKLIIDYDVPQYQLVRYPTEVLTELQKHPELLAKGISVFWMGHQIQMLSYFTRRSDLTGETTRANFVIQLLGSSFNITKPNKLGGAVELVRLDRIPNKDWNTYSVAGIPTGTIVNHLLGRFQ